MEKLNKSIINEEKKKFAQIDGKTFIPVEEILSNRLIVEIKEQVNIFVSGLNIVNKGTVFYKISLGKIEISSKTLIIENDKIILSIVKRIVCKYYGIPFSEVISKTRIRDIVTKRQIMHFFLNKYTKFSLEKIGREIGGKDHATVLHSIKTVNNLVDGNRPFRTEIRELDLLIEKSLTPE